MPVIGPIRKGSAAATGPHLATAKGRLQRSQRPSRVPRPADSHHTLHSATVELRPTDDRGVDVGTLGTRAGVFVFPSGYVNSAELAERD
jgi:hypothetical protein